MSPPLRNNSSNFRRWLGCLRTRSTTTKNRNLQFRGAVSTGFFEFSPVDFFPLLQVFCVAPQNIKKIARFPVGEKSAESCHVSGCHGFFFGPKFLACSDSPSSRSVLVVTSKVAANGVMAGENTGKKQKSTQITTKKTWAEAVRRGSSQTSFLLKSGHVPKISKFPGTPPPPLPPNPKYPHLKQGILWAWRFTCRKKRP